MERCTTNSVRGRWILVATILASGMAFLDGTVVTVALPKLQIYFNTDLMGLQWIVDAYALTLAAFLLTAGSMGDIFGQRKIFAIGIVSFIVFSVACGFAQSAIQLIMWRALQGIGSALMIPGSLAIINACFAEENRGRAIGLWAGFSGGIAAMGPFVGGWLTEVLGWRYIFYVNFPIGLIALYITLSYIPKLEGLSHKTIDWLGTLLITISLATLAYGLIEGPVHGWGSAVIIACLSVGIISLFLFVMVEVKSRFPMLPFKILGNRNIVGANIITFFLYFALNGLIFFMVLNFQQLQHYSPIDAGLALLPPIIIITFLSGAGGMMADRFGSRWPLAVGAFIVGCGMVLLILPGISNSYMRDFLPGLVLFGLGMAIVIAPVTKSALSVEDHLSGTASGVNNAISRVAALMAIAMLGALAISIFSHQLHDALQNSNLSVQQGNLILMQTHKLGAITIPTSFSTQTQQIIQSLITSVFISSYRWVMGICALFAFISASIAIVCIRDTNLGLVPEGSLKD